MRHSLMTVCAIAMAAVLLAVTVPAAAQTPVTAADIQRLQDNAGEIAGTIANLRGRARCAKHGRVRTAVHAHWRIKLHAFTNQPLIVRLERIARVLICGGVVTVEDVNDIAGGSRNCLR